MTQHITNVQLNTRFISERSHKSNLIGSAKNTMSLFSGIMSYKFIACDKCAFLHIPGWISTCAQGTVSHNNNIILPAELKQLWLGEIGMAFNLFLKSTYAKSFEKVLKLYQLVYIYLPSHFS